MRSINEELSAACRTEMKEAGVWTESCPVSLERLEAVTVSHVDFDGVTHDDGQLVVFDVLSEAVKRVFATLYEIRFPIASIRPIHEFGGDDRQSMAANNSSCFNHRNVPGTSSVSMHAYGVAIDINPLQNPFITFGDIDGTATIEPPASWQYVNRLNKRAGMVEEIVSTFESEGLNIWGGKWTTPIDYHHFQPPRAIAELLSMISREDGAVLFRWFKDHMDELSRLPAGEKLLPAIELYREDRTEFLSGGLDKLLEIALGES